MSKLKTFYLLFLIVLSIDASGQLSGLKIKKATGRVIIDGQMNERDWTEADIANHFKQVFPFDSSFAKAQTEVRMTYDDQFVYIFAVMHNIGSRKYVTPSLRIFMMGNGPRYLGASFRALPFGIEIFLVDK